MNEYQLNKAYDKCIATIISCKTKAQLRTAENMAELFFEHLEKPTRIRLYLKTLIHNHSINCI